MEIQALAGVLGDVAAIGRAGPATAAPAPGAAARVARLMPPAAPTATDAATPALAPAMLTTPAGSPTIGDAILSGLRGVSMDMGSKWSAVSHALDVPDLHTTDLLRLQLTISQMSVQYDLVGKAISRSTQNIDQLVKLQ
jgi:type III secretion protein I